MSDPVIGETWNISGAALAEILGCGVTYYSDPYRLAAKLTRSTGLTMVYRAHIGDRKTGATSWRFDVTGFASDDPR